MSLVAAETIDTLAKVSMIGVTYKSSPQAIMDLVAGRIQVMVSDFATAMPQVRAGRLRVVAVTTAKRSALVPDAPPIGETLRGFDLAGWSGLLAPAGTPKDIVAKLAQVTLDTLARADVRAKLAAVGLEADPLGSEAFGRYLREQIAHWGRLIREAGIQPE
jgi:tripartite-type tricarboxylate transporter receptor subunit TctC